MRRRDFITLLGGAAASPILAPLAVRAQQPVMPAIGWLDSSGKAESTFRIAAFREGLNETGFVEGRNVAFEFRWAEGQLDRLPELAADLVRRQVAVIVTTNITTPAAKAATSKIPVVFVSGGDPIDNKLVTNLNRPGGNVTGVSYTTTPLNPKRLEILHELVPKPAVIAVLLNPTSRLADDELQDVEKAARGLGRQILALKAGTERDIDAAFAAMTKSGVGALLVGGSAFFVFRRRQIAALAARHALPTITYSREFVLNGGLMSYGARDTDAYRRGGVYVGRILKGANPGDLPVEMPSKYELVINLAVARAFGLEIPPKVLALVDEVIE